VVIAKAALLRVLARDPPPALLQSVDAQTGYIPGAVHLASGRAIAWRDTRELAPAGLFFISRITLLAASRFVSINAWQVNRRVVTTDVNDLFGAEFLETENVYYE
jgi:hypothetical protein